jgi:hypothetical protein
MQYILGVIQTLSFVLFVTKFIIHAFLDSKNGYEVKYSPFLASEYILPYTKEVNNSYSALKLICNRCLYLAAITFFIGILLLLFKSYKSS